MWPAAEGEAEGQAAPMLGQLRLDGVLVARDPQAAKAKGEGLPEAAGGGGMDAVAGVAAHVVDVGEGRTHEVGVGLGGVTQAAGGPGMDGRAERGAIGVVGARSVVVPVGAQLLQGVLVGEEDLEQEDVGLLEHLVLVCPLDAEQSLHGPGAHGVGGPVDLLAGIEAVKLLDKTASRGHA